MKDHSHCDRVMPALGPEGAGGNSCKASSLLDVVGLIRLFGLASYQVLRPVARGVARKPAAEILGGVRGIPCVCYRPLEFAGALLSL